MLVQFAFTSHWWVLSLHSSRSNIKKRKQYEPPTSQIVYNPRHLTQENNQFCSMLIERRASINPRGKPLQWPIREAPPELRNGYLFQTSGVVEVYERVGKSVSFWSAKRPKRANRRILWLWKSRDNFLVFWFVHSLKTVHLQQLKVMQSSKLGIWKGYHLSIEGIL